MIDGDEVHQIKGAPYRLSELLGDAAAAAPFAGGRYVTLRLTAGTRTLNEDSRGLGLALSCLRYLFTGKGVFGESPAHISAFVRSRTGVTRPDVQLHIMPATLDLETMNVKGQYALEREPGVSISPNQMRPESLGTIRIISPDPRAHPSIQPNYLSASVDQEVAVASLRLCRKIAEQPSLRRLVDHEILPGPDFGTDEQLLEYARMAGSTGFHPVGTCAMGAGDKDVLDPQLRVRGVEGLRVVDASIMPRITSGNTNGPTIMIAEKAADMILGKSM